MSDEKKISRREFLKGSAAVAVGAAVATFPTKAFAHKEHKTARRLAMVIDLRKCYGCHACSVSCKAEFNVPLGVWRAWVKQIDKGSYPDTRRPFLPRLCNHCDNPPCVKVCPVNATYAREKDGAVIIDVDKCIGCKLCIPACPYNARFFNPVTRLADKCTFCVHRIDKGVVPACVNTCPANARIFGDLNDPDSEVAKLVSTQPVQTLKPELGTKPQVFYIFADKAVMGRIKETGAKEAF